MAERLSWFQFSIKSPFQINIPMNITIFSLIINLRKTQSKSQQQDSKENDVKLVNPRTIIRCNSITSLLIIAFLSNYWNMRSVPNDWAAFPFLHIFAMKDIHIQLIFSYILFVWNRIGLILRLLEINSIWFERKKRVNLCVHFWTLIPSEKWVNWSSQLTLLFHRKFFCPQFLIFLLCYS